MRRRVGSNLVQAGAHAVVDVGTEEREQPDVPLLRDAVCQRPPWLPFGRAPFEDVEHNLLFDTFWGVGRGCRRMVFAPVVEQAFAQRYPSRVASRKLFKQSRI